MTRQSEEFHPQAARRMFLAVVDQAILTFWKITKMRRQRNNGC